MAKQKLWEFVQELMQNNMADSKDNVKKANQQFNDYTSKNGSYNTNEHTTTVGELRKAYKNTPSEQSIKKSTNDVYKQKKEEQNNKLVSQNSDMWNQVQNIAIQLQNASAMSVNQNKTYNRNNVDSNNNSLKNNQVQLANKNETENAKRVDTVAYSNTKSNAENGNVFNYIKDKAKLGVESFGDNILNLYTTDMIKNNQKAQKLNNILGDDS